MSIETGIEYILGEHDNLVRSIAISDDNNLIVTGSYVSSLKIWNILTKEYAIIDKQEDIFFSVAISNDNKYIFSGSYGIIK